MPKKQSAKNSAKKKAKKSINSAKKSASKNFYGIQESLKSWLSQAKLAKSSQQGFSAEISVTTEASLKDLLKSKESQIKDWELKELKSTNSLVMISDNNGPHWICVLDRKGDHDVIVGGKERKDAQHVGEFGSARDLVGKAVLEFLSKSLASLQVGFYGLSQQQILGALVGIDLASYKFKPLFKNEPRFGFGKDDACLQLYTVASKLNESLISEAAKLASGTNLARHLVNLPAEVLNPRTYSEQVADVFKSFKSCKVSVWDEAKIKKEKMGLLHAVGKASVETSRMVHISYRPSGAKSKAPIAFVGKGITFDSGGLGIKPSGSMRLMKKDMGGSAAVVGLAYWVASQEISKNCDFYIALAENSISDDSFRPGDIIKARNGMLVEIDHTDAEGRLVLADVIDVALTQGGKDKPRILIDVATLTGAIKAALGDRVAGLYANSEPLATKLEESSVASGDWVWSMPLFQPYRGQLMSPNADLVNSGSGWGGSTTAALFLESFVDDTDWAHLDIYAWSDAPVGAIGEKGGSGQGVQVLAHWLKNSK